MPRRPIQYNSTIGVKQGCPLSPTLDEISSFIVCEGGSGVELGGIQVHFLIYADEIVVFS